MEAFILCGGKSERLGYPKEMLRVDGAPLALQLARRLRQIFSSVGIITNTSPYLEYCSEFPLIRDEFQHLGPLSGIHAGLNQCQGDRAFFLACDMPLVHNDHVRRIVGHAELSSAQAVVASVRGVRQPVCGIFSKSLLPSLQGVLASAQDLSINRFLDRAGTESLEFEAEESLCFRDIDEAEDMALLRRMFSDVEPLPVCRVPIHCGRAPFDIVAEECPLSVYVNGLKLVTVLCLPTAMREMAIGLAVYLGLIKEKSAIEDIRMDYAGNRAMLQLKVSDDTIRNASQVLITSTCGASIYGGQIETVSEEAIAGGYRARLSHILDCLKSLRSMGPVFNRSGSTHQAAFTDGERIRIFFEDIGRHNAVDKIIGSALLNDIDLSHGVIVSTGRLSSEMVVKAARRGVPILASPSGVTTNAISLAEKHGVTFIGFARGGRGNIYTYPARILGEEAQ